MNLKTAVIFGATGATGLPIARELLKRRIKTRVVSRNSSRLEERFKGLDVQIVAANLSDSEAAKRAADSCEVIFHCVGVPLQTYQEHIPIARNTVAAMEATGAKAVLVSSFWSYGPAQSNPVKESFRPALFSPKEIIRREQEDLLRQAGGLVVLLPDFYGPGAELGFANAAIRATAAGKTANWIGNPDLPRELIFVPDVGFPIVELAHQESAYGQRWNVPGQGAITPRQFLQLAAIQSGTSLKVRQGSPFLFTLLGLFNPEIRALKDLLPLYTLPPILDATKVRALIGDYPVTSYSDGVRQTLRWMESTTEAGPA
ncbi:MAG: NAD(P)H-binding protein [Terriglobia bacterium]